MTNFETDPRIAPHLIGVYYQRKAFDLHNSGKSREEAEELSRRTVLDMWELAEDTIFPPVPWERYEEFYAQR